jgi:hypothetical protein
MLLIAQLGFDLIAGQLAAMFIEQLAPSFG